MAWQREVLVLHQQAARRRRAAVRRAVLRPAVLAVVVHRVVELLGLQAPQEARRVVRLEARREAAARGRTEAQATQARALKTATS
jgi:hypothetical protein